MTANNASGSKAISPLEFNEWMCAIGYFEPNPTIAIATSGGADSMALLLLAKNWIEVRKGKLISLTVNHNLRPESAVEAMRVKDWCNRLSIEHHILSWEHSSLPVSSIQASAREARYRLMLKYCQQNSILHLFTAHHLNDQAETLFFRLARGSKLEGLSSMAAQTIISGVRLLRPFLQMSKIRILATLENYGQKWIEDPSNQNSQYTRVHIRKQLAVISADKDILKKTNYIVYKLSLFRKLLENKLASELANAIEIYPYGYAEIKLDKFNILAEFISLKTLGALVQTLSGSNYQARSEKLLRLDRDLRSNFFSKRSFGGLIFEKESEQKIIVYREENAIGKPSPIIVGNKILWDSRFLVECSSAIFPGKPMEVRALGSAGLAYIKKYHQEILRKQPPARILRTIPSIWILEQLICVPHINYMNKESIISDIKIHAQFYPVKPLAGSSIFVMNNPL